jgi:hypothetical protein
MPLPAQVIPRTLPVTPIAPTPIAPAPIRIHPINVDPLPLTPRLPLDSAPRLTPTPIPTNLDLRGTLGPVGGSTPTVNRDQAEPATDMPQTFNQPTASKSATAYVEPALEVYDAQARGVALHLGGNPPPGEQDDDGEGEEGSKWWLWVLLVVGVLVLKSWLGKK